MRLVQPRFALIKRQLHWNMSTRLISRCNTIAQHNESTERTENVLNPDSSMELGPVDDTKRDYTGLAPIDSHEQSTDTEAERKAYETVGDEHTSHKPPAPVEIVGHPMTKFHLMRKV